MAAAARTTAAAARARARAAAEVGSGAEARAVTVVAAAMVAVAEAAETRALVPRPTARKVGLASRDQARRAEAEVKAVTAKEVALLVPHPTSNTIGTASCDRSRFGLCRRGYRRSMIAWTLALLYLLAKNKFEGAAFFRGLETAPQKRTNRALAKDLGHITACNTYF